MQNITFNGYHLPTLARLARELGSPQQGPFAEFVWRLSNQETLPVMLAESFMTWAGYEPFQGYPLKRFEGLPSDSHVQSTYGVRP